MGGTATPTPVDSPTIEIVFRGTAGNVVVGTEGGPARVEPAPQGGTIVLAGVRTRGMHPCLQLTAAIRDEQQMDRIVSIEQRPAQQDPPAEDGWSYPRAPAYLFNYANLPACPNAALTHPLIGDSYRLEIVAADRDDNEAFTSLHIVPTCAGDAYCEQVCLFSTAGPATFSR